MILGVSFGVRPFSFDVCKMMFHLLILLLKKRIPPRMQRAKWLLALFRECIYYTKKRIKSQDGLFS